MKHTLIALWLIGTTLLTASQNYLIKAKCPWWQTPKEVVATARANGKIYLEFSDPKSPKGYVSRLCDANQSKCVIGRCMVLISKIKRENKQ